MTAAAGGSALRPAARILLEEAAALPAALAPIPPADFDRPTVCTEWSVRDVLAHCGAALTAAATDTVHGFSPQENQRDVDDRKSWPLPQVLDELWEGYEAAAAAIDRAGGRLDGVGLGEWVHGGDVREALDLPQAYVSAGIDLAIPLLFERAEARGAVGLTAVIDGEAEHFGSGPRQGRLVTDRENFVRLCGNRRPDPDRYQLEGVEPAGLVLFT